MRWLHEHRGWVLIVALFLAAQHEFPPKLQIVGVVLWFAALILLLRRLDDRDRRRGVITGIARE